MITSYQRNDANLVSLGRAQVPKAPDEVPERFSGGNVDQAEASIKELLCGEMFRG